MGPGLVGSGSLAASISDVHLESPSNRKDSGGGLDFALPARILGKVCIRDRVYSTVLRTVRTIIY